MFVDPQIAQRGACPGPDQLTRLVEAEAGGRSLTDDEIKSFVSLMLVAGGETTDKAIANLWWNLLRVPEALAEVTADPALLDAAGFSFNFCTYTCEMTLRDEDGEEVRDENGYVTLMDDGFSWGAHWEYPRAGDDVWGEKKHWAYRTWERDAWRATRAGEHIMRMWRACLARRPIHAPGSEVEWL
jgi:cytochrome P450